MAIIAIWLGVAVASAFSPDMVTGSRHEHLPLAGVIDWAWGLIATSMILVTLVVGRRAGEQTWRSVAGTTTGIWAVTALVSVFAPVMVTGSDPARIPVGALVAPVAGTLATAFLCILAAATPAASGPPDLNGHR
jgi:hypothetical protein